MLAFFDSGAFQNTRFSVLPVTRALPVTRVLPATHVVGLSLDLIRRVRSAKSGMGSSAQCEAWMNSSWLGGLPPKRLGLGLSFFSKYSNLTDIHTKTLSGF